MLRNKNANTAFYCVDEEEAEGGAMTEDKPYCDKVNPSTVTATERECKDPLPWLIRNLRQKQQQLTEESPLKDPREQTQ